MSGERTPTLRVPAQQNVAPTSKILIVEDDVLVAKALARGLAHHGYSVECCVDADAAMRALATCTFDVVLSDIQLPTLSGVQLLELVRAYDLDVPVILATGQPTIETAIAAVDLGALQYLVKPIDTEVLLAAVKRATRLHRLARVKRDALALNGEDKSPGDRAGLNAAFDRMLDGLWSAFQPIVDNGGNVIAYEALLRSKEPSLRHPLAVLSAAETLGRVSDVGQRMRELAADAFRHTDRQLFLNLHPQDLMDPRLADANGPLAPFADRVVFELTERSSLDAVKGVAGRIRALRELGYRIAVDDLGAGYAGLGSFAALEPDIVKLDVSLIRKIDTSDVKQRIVGSMATLAKEMGMHVVAEGVETPGERRAVSLLGCDWLQGYLFAKPGPAFPEVTGG